MSMGTKVQREERVMFSGLNKAGNETKKGRATGRGTLGTQEKARSRLIKLLVS